MTPSAIDTPFTNRTLKLGSFVLGYDSLSIIGGTHAAMRRAVSVLQHDTRLGVAMQAASQNQLAAYYMGIPVRTMFSLIWAISAGVSAVAGHPAGAGRPWSM